MKKTSKSMMMKKNKGKGGGDKMFLDELLKNKTINKIKGIIEVDYLAENCFDRFKNKIDKTDRVDYVC